MKLTLTIVCDGVEPAEAGIDKWNSDLGTLRCLAMLVPGLTVDWSIKAEYDGGLCEYWQNGELVG